MLLLKEWGCCVAVCVSWLFVVLEAIRVSQVPLKSLSCWLHR